jgi:hypothetical protein
MAISSVGTALDLIAKASKALDSVRERAKTSKDAALKDNISNLYDDFLDLKAVVLRLTEEVNALKAAQTRKPMVFRAPFYYQDNDETPFCPACHEARGQAFHLAKNNAGFWTCPICKHTFGDDSDVPAFGIIPMGRG